MAVKRTFFLQCKLGLSNIKTTDSVYKAILGIPLAATFEPLLISQRQFTVTSGGVTIYVDKVKPLGIDLDENMVTEFGKGDGTVTQVVELIQKSIASKTPQRETSFAMEVSGSVQYLTGEELIAALLELEKPTAGAKKDADKKKETAAAEKTEEKKADKKTADKKVADKEKPTTGTTTKPGSGKRRQLEMDVDGEDVPGKAPEDKEEDLTDPPPKAKQETAKKDSKGSQKPKAEEPVQEETTEPEPIQVGSAVVLTGTDGENSSIVYEVTEMSRSGHKSRIAELLDDDTVSEKTQVVLTSLLVPVIFDDAPDELEDDELEADELEADDPAEEEEAPFDDDDFEGGDDEGDDEGETLHSDADFEDPADLDFEEEEDLSDFGDDDEVEDDIDDDDFD